MDLDKSLCDFVAKIKEDPLKKVEGLTVGKFYALQAHLEECSKCAAIVDEITEKYKDTPSDPNSEWDRTRYN